MDHFLSYICIYFRLKRQRGGRFKPVSVGHIHDEFNISLPPLTDRETEVRYETKVNKKPNIEESTLEDDQVYENTTFIGENSNSSNISESELV